MRRCLELAAKGLGYTYPNPLVGSVIVHEGRIIGEGYHRKAGEAHAEVLAIESVTDRSLLKDSILYVNLEPCSHYGRTPPCAERIINEGIPVVVVGTTDTSSKVSGRGIEMMRNAGLEVITGVCNSEARAINARFFTFLEKGRPYVILKWAMSADGFMDVVRPAGSPVEPYWITGMTERILVHRWRASEQVILAGGGTIRTDNPELNVRYWEGSQPLKAIVSLSGDISTGSSVFRGEREVLLFTAADTGIQNSRTIRLSGKREEVIDTVLNELYLMGIQSVFVEGGRNIHEMFIASGKWDEARIFTGKATWGAGLPAPSVKGNIRSTTRFPGSTLDVVENEYIQPAF